MIIKQNNNVLYDFLGGCVIPRFLGGYTGFLMISSVVT
jgi:hypothetical protein